MIVRRSCKIYFRKWLTRKKCEEVKEILQEFARVQYYFAQAYEDQVPDKTKFTFLHKEYIKEIKDALSSPLSARLIKQAIADAYGQIQSAKSNMPRRNGVYYRPTFSAKRALLTSCSAVLEKSNNIKSFDMVLKLFCLRDDKGRGYHINIPLKKHRVYNYWDLFTKNSGGRRASSMFVTSEYVQIFWEFEVDSKKEQGNMIGVDFGLNTLLTTSEGAFIGTDMRHLIDKLRRKKQYSKAYYRCKNEIKYYLDTCLKSINYDRLRLLVVEDLRGINFNVRERLTKNIRSVLYNVSTWHINQRIRQHCELNRVSYRRVPPAYTSQRCFHCGHIEKANRVSRDLFICQKCGHTDNADINASKNILHRFVTGKYGSCYQQDYLELLTTGLTG